MNTEASKDLLIAQYGALRNEIHQRVDQRQQLLIYTLIGAASFFGIGLQSWVSGVTVLCYPLLAFFLACAWSQHDIRIGQIKLFLREIEDEHLSNFAPGWESYRQSTFVKKRLHAVSFSARGLFAGSELLALVIGLARYTPDPQMIVGFVFLAATDVLVVLATILVLSRRHPHKKEEANG